MRADIHKVGKRILHCHPERSEAESRDPGEPPAASQQNNLPPSAPGDYWIYILTNERRTVLYIGITSALRTRVSQHGLGIRSGFASKYHADILIYFENFPDAEQAIAREKKLKKWSRAKKDCLIATINPDWCDLGKEMFEQQPAEFQKS